MRWIRIPDVDHGLAAGLQTISGETVQIDCGSNTYDGETAYKLGLKQFHPEVFFLSHYHRDHYNGLTHAPDSSQHIEKVRFPKIPEYEDRQEFLRDLLATEFLTRGYRTGAWPTDLFSTICRINDSEFSFDPVSRGDCIRTGSTKFEVLWPPEELPDGARKSFRRGTKKFNEAIEQDEVLRRITERIEEKEMVEPYLSGEEIALDNHNVEESLNNMKSLIEEREIPEVTKEARDNLRKAADQMSLVMHVDNRLLFMGDTIEKFIEQIVKQLREKGRDHFLMLITPHHGTRWDDAIKELSAEWAVSSAGKRDHGNLCPEFKSICNHNWITLWNGELFARVNTLEQLYPYRHRLLYK